MSENSEARKHHETANQIPGDDTKKIITVHLPMDMSLFVDLIAVIADHHPELPAASMVNEPDGTLTIYGPAVTL